MGQIVANRRCRQQSPSANSVTAPITAVDDGSGTAVTAPTALSSMEA
jgi:hypothetical protein